MRDYMDRRVTSPTWGPPPPCKQPLMFVLMHVCTEEIYLNYFHPYQVSTFVSVDH